MLAGPISTRYAKLPIRTKRLELRLPSEEDVANLRRMFRDRRTARALGAPLHSPAEVEEPRKMVRRTLREYRAGQHLSLSVLRRSDGRCIGRVGLRELDWIYRKVGSLSYWIDPEEWGQGYATEAARALCTIAFGQLRMRRIGSQALEGNDASHAVLRKLGFVLEGRERAAVRVGRSTYDMILYGLLNGELVPRRPARPRKRSAVRSRPSPRASRGGRST